MAQREVAPKLKSTLIAGLIGRGEEGKECLTRQRPTDVSSLPAAHSRRIIAIVLHFVVSSMADDPSTPAAASGGPNPLLAGLGVGLLLFVFSACTFSMLALPRLSRILAPTSGPTWAPPPPGTTPADATTPVTDSSDAVVGVPAGGETLQVGDSARNVNTGAVNLRQSPGFQNKPASDRLALVPAGAIVVIVGGPVEADGLRWWQVQWQGQEGWMAERRASGGLILQKAASP